MSPEDKRHGSVAGRMVHQRDGEPVCFACRVASADYQDEVRRNRAYGRWEPFVDAEPAREHVKALMAAGMPYRKIADAVSVAHRRVSTLVYGRSHQPPPRLIRPEFSAALLAIENPRPERVPGLGASRRIRGLQALGHRPAVLAEALGVSERRISQFANLAEPVIMRETHDRIAALYARLSMVLPEPKDARDAHNIAMCRRRAQRRHWLPPLAWDDVDDPAEQPIDWQYRPGDRADQLRDLAEQGVGITEACRRLKVGRESLERFCQRRGLSDVYHQLAGREMRAGNQHADEVA